MRASIYLPLLAALAGVFSSAASAQPSQVLHATKITEGAGGFTGEIEDVDQFGTSVAGLGDLNGDGVEDLAVGAKWDDDGGGFDEGSVWILFLNADGTVGSHQKISATEGGFTGPLEAADNFGEAVTAIGDLDGDGVTDVAVGAPGTNINKGAVYVLFMNADGTVRAHQRIGENEGGFTAELTNADSFGEGVAPLGDLDGDGVTDLAVGAPLDDDGPVVPDEFDNRGAVYVLFLNADGTVREHQKISQTEGGFTGALIQYDNMGKDVAAVGDVDGNGVTDLAVGTWGDQDGGPLTGAVWVLFLDADGTVLDQQKISATQGGFTGDIGQEDFFGHGVGTVGDLDGDGVPDLAVGAFNDDDDEGALFNTGAVYLLYLNTDGTVKGHFKLSNATPGFEDRLEQDDQFGSDVALLGDLDGDGLLEFAVGAYFDADAGFGAGAAWILSLDVEKSPTATADGPTVAPEVAVGPNPFREGTTFRFVQPAAGLVRLTVYDAAGRLVRRLVEGPLPAGAHEVRWDGRDGGGAALPSGIYLYRLESGDREETGRLALVR